MGLRTGLANNKKIPPLAFSWQGIIDPQVEGTMKMRLFVRTAKNIKFNQLRYSPYLAVSQTIGSSVVLYLISPEMAGATLVVMPVVVACGTLFGSLLRRLSRRAQEQGARATAAGEECISNIRTGITRSGH